MIEEAVDVGGEVGVVGAGEGEAALECVRAAEVADRAGGGDVDVGGVKASAVAVRARREGRASWSWG